ncbi:hypothetical protein SEA_PIPERIS_18 [Microbacterium phage Piperis]|uniref:DUF1360 domain-containing protein n=1 Tax=Microbacterium phage Piperis TaxID=2584496 RepID=A0A4Y5NZT5_9CAUD|nr:hypothetical protein SEA_PIPERIS_18 [Microbacterium phage Piperis]
MDNPVQNLARLGMILLATARATRFITSDMLGEWTLVGPAKRWAARREVPDDIRDELERRFEREHDRDEPTANPPQKWGWRSKLVKGLDCPFCVGFWIGGVILLGEATIGRSPLRPLWRFGIAMLGLNYLVGHISSRIDG